MFLLFFFALARQPLLLVNHYLDRIPYKNIFRLLPAPYVTYSNLFIIARKLLFFLFIPHIPLMLAVGPSSVV